MSKRFGKLLVMVLLVSLISGCHNENSSDSNKNSDTDKNDAKDEELKESIVNVVLLMGAKEEGFFVE